MKDPRAKAVPAIKAGFDFDGMIGKGRNEQANEVIVKGVSFLKSIDSVNFWMGRKPHETAFGLFAELVGNGLIIDEGDGRAVTARMTLDGTITVQ